jgi:hypothetical protein
MNFSKKAWIFPMKHKKRPDKPVVGKQAPVVTYRLPFPRPVCLEKCTMETPRGYEADILMTLKAFSSQEAYRRKTPHKLEGKDNTWSLDVSSRADKYRMLFYVDNGICKITHLCTEETHK